MPLVKIANNVTDAEFSWVFSNAYVFTTTKEKAIPGKVFEMNEDDIHKDSFFSIDHNHPNISTLDILGALAMASAKHTTLSLCSNSGKIAYGHNRILSSTQKREAVSNIHYLLVRFSAWCAGLSLMLSPDFVLQDAMETLVKYMYHSSDPQLSKVTWLGNKIDSGDIPSESLVSPVKASNLVIWSLEQATWDDDGHLLDDLTIAGQLADYPQERVLTKLRDIIQNKLLRMIFQLREFAPFEEQYRVQTKF